MKIHDITPKISPGINVWPGDVSFSQKWTCRLDQGASVNLSSLESTVHLGAHADAPLHYDVHGKDISEVDLNNYLGPCLLVDASNSNRDKDGRLLPEVLKFLPANLPERVLYKTEATFFNRPYEDGFASLHPDIVHALADKGVKLIGIDTPSVDPLEDKKLLSHNAFRERGLLILEGLKLDEVPPGMYELIALPLPLVGFDASPVRAILREIPQ